MTRYEESFTETAGTCTDCSRAASQAEKRAHFPEILLKLMGIGLFQHENGTVLE